MFLKQYFFQSLPSMDTSIFHYISLYGGNIQNTHVNCDNRRNLRTHATNGDNQLVLKIITHQIDIQDPLNAPDPSLSCYLSSDVVLLNLHRYFHSDKCWWKKRRKTNCDGYVTVHIQDGVTQTWNTHTGDISICNKQIGQKTIKIYHGIEAPCLTSVNYIHLYSYDVIASATSTGSTTLVHQNN